MYSTCKGMYLGYFEAISPHITVLVYVVESFKVKSTSMKLIISAFQAILTVSKEDFNHLTPPEAFTANGLRGSWTDPYTMYNLVSGVMILNETEQRGMHNALNISRGCSEK